jgi:exodeoxyribonuclease V alpha subunit
MSIPNSPATLQKEKLAAMLAKLRAAKVPSTPTIQPEIPSEVTVTITPEQLRPAPSVITDKYGNPITLNSKQLEFVNLASSGQSCVLIGAAGTGKTTCQKAVVQSLIQSGLAGILDPLDHAHLPQKVPGIVICAYTRRATANIRRNVSEDMQNNCITIHKLLEYQPVYYEVTDPNTGDSRNTMKFEATRNRDNPLPPTIHTIIIEEASMVGTELFQEILNAAPHNPQFIFLGDIQQLPPVFGPAILGFKLLELPVVELTEVYRQALESPIISLAHRILSGVPIKASEFPDWKNPGQMTIHPWQKRIDAPLACNSAGLFLIGGRKKDGTPVPGAYQQGFYDPEEDIVLCPFNKAFGTDELNRIIANFLAHNRGEDVYEILAGFNKHYFSVGDKILYDKLDAIITGIEPNPAYSGAKVQHHSPTMDYWGFDPDAAKYANLSENDFDVDLILTAAAAGSDERTAQCSHIITIKFTDDGRVYRITKAAEVNATQLGYCLTVHKSQGSEWRKVFILLHQSHNTMVSRELLYTAVTRAREELYVICEPDHFIKGIQSQRVKGNTLLEKAEYFKGKLAEQDEKL